MLAGSLLLGGLLPLSHSSRDAWAPSGAWRWPVGDPYELVTERPAEPGEFFLLRSVDTDGLKVTHQGADIGCGASGAFVRAAAAGLVMRVADHGSHGGYGTHVVLAHRLPGGVLAYSVYAHMRTASIRVRAGQFVTAGTRLGRVGMTGRATTPHLHFEVRTAKDPGERWELANVEDPVAFVDERLPSHRADTSGVAAYLEWAECASLLPTQVKGDDALTREAWWRMLVVTDRGSLCDPGLPGENLRDSLIAAGTLGRGAKEANAGDAVEWSELARDLNHIRRSSLRGGKAPFRKAKHRRVCETNLGTPTPTRKISELSGRSGKPSLSEAVLLIADLTGPAPEPPKKAAAPTTKPAVPRADSLARAGAPVAAKATSAKKSGATTVSKATPGDSVAKSKPAAARADSAAKVASATAKKDSVVKAKPSTTPAATGTKTATTSAKKDTLAKAKTAGTTTGSATKTAATPAKKDSLAKPKPATTSAATGTKPATTSAKTDTVAKAKSAATPAKKDTVAKAKTAATPAKKDTLAKAKPSTTKKDSAARKPAAPAAKADTSRS